MPGSLLSAASHSLIMACANLVREQLCDFPFSDENAEIQAGYVPGLTGG